MTEENREWSPGRNMKIGERVDLAKVFQDMTDAEFDSLAMSETERGDPDWERENVIDGAVIYRPIREVKP